MFVRTEVERTAMVEDKLIHGGRRQLERAPAPAGVRAICERTGLSTSTVSLALRGAYGVSEATRRRVLDAAREVGYDLRRLRTADPDSVPLRRGVRMKPGAPSENDGSPAIPEELRVDFRRFAGRRQIAIVYPARGGLEAVARAAHYGRYLRGIQAAAQQLAVDLVFLPTHQGDADPLLRFMLDTGNGRPDGVILLGLGDEAPAVQRALSATVPASRPAPVVLLSRYVPELPCSWVSVDHVRAGALMTDHLIDRGYHSIALVSPNLDNSSWQRQRREGYLQSMVSHSRLADPLGDAIDPQGEDLHAMVDRLARFIRGESQHGRDPALFISNDVVALSVKERLAQRGLTAPAHYGLAGYDNIADEVSGKPEELSSIGFPRERMGALALRVARELCDDPKQEQQHIIVAPELHIRYSSERPGVAG